VYSVGVRLPCRRNRNRLASKIRQSPRTPRPADRAAIAAALESLSDARGVGLEEAQRVCRVIARFKVGAADFRTGSIFISNSAEVSVKIAFRFGLLRGVLAVSIPGASTVPN